ncbi:hypothetical protein RJT34_30395 [Clitoria ternatea]|uniref:Uncharacterized protein n=1 Tax=Clitoria ternatea TaxID=43366 RepID=A0AAN9ESB1_CLITE
MNKMELKDNEGSNHKEDWKVWKELPHVTGLDGRPMPRKALKTRKEADDKFWDFIFSWETEVDSQPSGSTADTIDINNESASGKPGESEPEGAAADER